MKLNTEQLRTEIERKIDGLEQQKQRLREQIAGIDENVRGLRSTIEALETVVREASSLNPGLPDLEVELEAPAEMASSETNPAKETSDALDAVAPENPSLPTREAFDEEDEETLRMVESLFVESDVDCAEPVRPNGRNRVFSEDLFEEPEPVELEPENPSPAASAGSDNSDSLVPRFLKKYL